MTSYTCPICGHFNGGRKDSVRARIWKEPERNGERRRLKRARICRSCAGLAGISRHPSVWAIQLRLRGVR